MDERDGFEYINGVGHAVGAWSAWSEMGQPRSRPKKRKYPIGFAPPAPEAKDAKKKRAARPAGRPSGSGARGAKRGREA